MEMYKVYKDVDNWARPKDLVESGFPNLWGENGISPDGVV